jgi:hypothetical protein
MKKIKLISLVALAAVSIIFMGCGDLDTGNADTGNADTRRVLEWTQENFYKTSVAYPNARLHQVEFDNARGLPLSKADFQVDGGAVIEYVELGKKWESVDWSDRVYIGIGPLTAPAKYTIYHVTANPASAYIKDTFTTFAW